MVLQSSIHAAITVRGRALVAKVTLDRSSHTTVECQDSIIALMLMGQT
jgi:hypothetical protein